MLSFQEIVLKLQHFWAEQGCSLLEPYDVEMGAGTFHPATVLYCLGPRPWKFAHVQPSRRPADGRYGENPNRLQRFHQFQVILKPSPDNIQELYLESLAVLGLDPKKHDIRFVEDDWESPTLGASGLGWEVWCDGMEVTQFTYMQQIGGIECELVAGELAYGIERLAMYIQGIDNVYELAWNNPKNPQDRITYGDLFLQNEKEFSAFCLDYADTALLFKHFDEVAGECQALLARNLALPAYDHCIRASHLFNILDARGAVSTTERAAYIARIRALAKGCCATWLTTEASLLNSKQK